MKAQHGLIGCLLGIITIILFLPSCASPTVRQVDVREVPVAVATKPIRPDQLPPVVAPLPARPKSDAAASDLLLAKVCELYGYMVQADPLLRLAAGIGAVPVVAYPECADRR